MTRNADKRNPHSPLPRCDFVSSFLFGKHIYLEAPGDVSVEGVG
jgi:hypothetical protein